MSRNLTLCCTLSVTFRLHPTYVHAMNNLGNILKERNELIEAEQLLSKAVSIQYVVPHKGTQHSVTHRQPLHFSVSTTDELDAKHLLMLLWILICAGLTLLLLG